VSGSARESGQVNAWLELVARANLLGAGPDGPPSGSCRLVGDPFGLGRIRCL